MHDHGPIYSGIEGASPGRFAALVTKHEVVTFGKARRGTCPDATSRATLPHGDNLRLDWPLHERLSDLCSPYRAAVPVARRNVGRRHDDRLGADAGRGIRATSRQRRDDV